MWSFLRQEGQLITNLYIQALLAIPPRQIAEFYNDVLVALGSTFRETGISKQWLEQALI